MSRSFIYQPHVHEAEGVLTPDLIVDNVALIAGVEATTPLPLGLNLLSTESSLQDPTGSGCASAALVLVAGGRGALATVGSAHWDPTATAATPVPSEHWTPVLVCREAVRLPVLVDRMPDLVLETTRVETDSSTTIGQTPLSALAGLETSLAQFAANPAPRRSVLILSPRHSDPKPGQATGYRVSLNGAPGMPVLTHAYSVERLAKNGG